MIKINLLPKEYQKKRFSVALDKNTMYVIAGGAAVLILLVAYTFFFQILPLNKLQENIEYAKLESEKFNDEIRLVNELKQQKNLILTRMGTIEELDRGRDAWVNVISDLGSRITDYLWLTGFSQTPVGDQTEGSVPAATTIEGRSFSINSLATFLIRLKKSPYLSNVDLVSVELKEEQAGMNAAAYEAYSFKISCNLILGTTENIESEKKLIADKLATGSEF
jgi:Tfp pilus assembly protein PilN